MPVQFRGRYDASGHHQGERCLGYGCVVGELVGVGQPGNYDRGPRRFWNGPGRVAHRLHVHQVGGREMGWWHLRVSWRVRQLGRLSHQSWHVVEIRVPVALSISVVSLFGGPSARTYAAGHHWYYQVAPWRSLWFVRGPASDDDLRDER